MIRARLAPVHQMVSGRWICNHTHAFASESGRHQRSICIRLTSEASHAGRLYRSQGGLIGDHGGRHQRDHIFRLHLLEAWHRRQKAGCGRCCGGRPGTTWVISSSCIDFSGASAGRGSCGTVGVVPRYGGRALSSRIQTSSRCSADRCVDCALNRCEPSY